MKSSQNRPMPSREATARRAGRRDRGRGYTPSIRRQSVNTSVKPRDFAMYKRQIMCQEVSAERQGRGLDAGSLILDTRFLMRAVARAEKAYCGARHVLTPFDTF